MCREGAMYFEVLAGPTPTALQGGEEVAGLMEYPQSALLRRLLMLALHLSSISPTPIHAENLPDERDRRVPASLS